MNHSPWQIEGRAAVLTTKTLLGRLDLDAPDQGMTSLQAFDTPVEGNLWGWQAIDNAHDGAERQTPKCRDAYIRGRDLVLTYAPTEACPFETQVYWRAGGDSNTDATSQLSLLVSIRTHLLDTEPVVVVHSQRSGLDTQRVDDTTAVVQQGNDGGPQLLEACHPDDQTSLELDGDTIRWRLFSHFLEKGVIRRARLAMAAATDADPLHAAYDRFVAAPLPLTT